MTRRRIALALAVFSSVAFGLVAAFAFAAGATVGAGGTMSFADPAGDGKGAPDITTVSVSDDYRTGNIVISARAVGWSTIDAVQKPDIDLYIDADNNPASGDRDLAGAEYDLWVGRNTEGLYAAFTRWDGSKWIDVTQPAVKASVIGDTITWSLNKSELGGTAAFGFFAASATYDSGGDFAAVDFAPDEGSWSYTMSTQPPAATPPTSVVKPVIAAGVITPKPVAGKRVTVTFAVTRSDDGRPLSSGKMLCDPSIQGKVLVHHESFKGATARLTFVIPKSAKGKTLKVKVTIRSGGQSTTRFANFHIG